jgi:hypothetical protein
MDAIMPNLQFSRPYLTYDDIQAQSGLAAVKFYPV